MTLPKFEKSRVVAARLKINGFGEEGDNALPIGQSKFFLVEARTYGVEHVEEKIGVVRVHKATILRHAEFDDVDVARKLLDEEDERRRLADEANSGIVRLGADEPGAPSPVIDGREASDSGTDDEGYYDPAADQSGNA